MEVINNVGLEIVRFLNHFIQNGKEKFLLTNAVLVVLKIKEESERWLRLELILLSQRTQV